MDFDKVSTLKFIDAYKRYEILWDTKHPEHYNKIQKQNAWEGIGKEFDKDADDCKKKMESLLSALRREKMKMVKRNGFRSSWFAFQSMKFLWDKNKHTTTPNGLPWETAQDAHSEEQERVAPKNSRPTTSSPGNRKIYHRKLAPVKRPRKPLSPRKKVQSSNENERLEKAIEILQSASSENTVDSCYHFGNFVASQLRHYDLKTRLSIQCAIMSEFARANEVFLNSLPSNHLRTSPYSCCVSPSHSDSAISQRTTENVQSATDVQNLNDSEYDQNASKDHTYIISIDCNAGDQNMEGLHSSVQNDSLKPVK